MKYRIFDPLGDLIATFDWKENIWSLEFEGKENKRIKRYWESVFFVEEDHIHYKGKFHDDTELGARKIENLRQFGYVVFLVEWPTKKELEASIMRKKVK